MRNLHQILQIAQFSDIISHRSEETAHTNRWVKENDKQISMDWTVFKSIFSYQRHSDYTTDIFAYQQQIISSD